MQVDGEGGEGVLKSGSHSSEFTKQGESQFGDDERDSLMAKTRGRASHPALLLHLLRPAIGTFSRTHCPLLASDLHRAPEGQTLAFYKLPFHPCHTGTHRGRCVKTQTDPTAESFPYRPLPKVRVC